MFAILKRMRKKLRRKFQCYKKNVTTFDKITMRHTWSNSSSDSSRAIGAKTVHSSVSSIAWLNDENFEHLQIKLSHQLPHSITTPHTHFNKLFSLSFVHSGCEMDLCTIPVRCCGCCGGCCCCCCCWFSNSCWWCCFSIAHIFSNEKSLSDGGCDRYDPAICLPAWCWNWNCCCWCKMSRIVPMSFLRLSSRWSIRTVRSLIWLVIELDRQKKKIFISCDHPAN